MVLTVTWLKASCHIQSTSMARKAYQMREPQRRCGACGVSLSLGGRFGLSFWAMQIILYERTGRTARAAPPGLVVRRQFPHPYCTQANAVPRGPCGDRRPQRRKGRGTMGIGSEEAHGLQPGDLARKAPAYRSPRGAAVLSAPGCG